LNIAEIIVYIPPWNPGMIFERESSTPDQVIPGQTLENMLPLNTTSLRMAGNRDHPYLPVEEKCFEDLPKAKKKKLLFTLGGFACNVGWIFLVGLVIGRCLGSRVVRILYICSVVSRHNA
jgi:hypothetical protein